YYRMNPLEANLQMASMRRHKTDSSDAHELAKTHFKVEREMTYVQDTYYEQMRAITRYYDEVDKEIILLHRDACNFTCFISGIRKAHHTHLFRKCFYSCSF
ncbi:hypothetical protein LAV73_19785, partial [Lysinibacillus xylanilyticus]|nr:hypothetical protein [Lysinibacillus xylanilyticus]